MKKQINEVGILVQAVLLVSLLYTFILTLFLKEFEFLFYLVMGLTLFSMAYNNYKIYHKKGMTVTYLVVGAVSILAVLFN